MFELIRQLVNLYGATGREAGVADAVEALVRDHVDSIRRDALGNLICEKRGTDAMAMQVSRSGVIAGTVSIPCRYVHSACEVIDLRDVEAARALLLEYLK